jgi:hypothetical protein
MTIKSFLAKPFAAFIQRTIKAEMASALSDQQKILDKLLKVGAKTAFGKSVNLKDVNDYQSFKQSVPKKESTTCFGGAAPFILPKHPVRPAG